MRWGLLVVGAEDVVVDEGATWPFPKRALALPAKDIVGKRLPHLQFSA